MRPVIKKLLLQAPLKPVYFKHIRAVFKQAELLDDFEISGMLALTVRTAAEFSNIPFPVPITGLKFICNKQKAGSIPIRNCARATAAWPIRKEPRKYLRQRVNRRLQMYGELESLDYVKLATGILIAYNKSTDFKEAFTTSDYKWNGRNYATVKTKVPAECARRVHAPDPERRAP